jgi:TetR/AcrR family transcriptional regulator, fatty acid biosynthesis regulator
VIPGIALVRDDPRARGERAMGSREEQREQREKTSRSLIEAALELSGAEGYASLSLRSVARKAGIAPTSFYRHFRDIDELGLAMVEQAEQVLRESLDKVRKKTALPAAAAKASRGDMLDAYRQMVRPWVEALMESVSGQKELMRLFFQERTGSSRALRKAISGGIDQMTANLAEDLERAGRQSGTRLREGRSAAQAMMTVACAGAMDQLGAPEPDLEGATDRVILKLGLLLVGATLRP